MDSLKVSVPLLLDDNYPTWSDRISSLLTLRDCKLALTRPARLPDELAMSDKALAIIRLHVSDRWLRRLSDAVDAHDAWTTLREEHTTALAPLASSIHTKIFSSTMKATETVDNFVDRIEVLQADLERLNMGLPVGTLVTHVLRSLTPSLAKASTHMAVVASTLTLSTLRIGLRAVAAMQAPESEERVAMTAQRDRRDRPPARNIGACHHCGVPGHRKFDCALWREANPPVKPPAAASPRVTTTPRAMSAKVGADAPRSGTIPHAICMTVGSTDATAWLVDSGASAHMCGDRAMFADLLSLKTPISVTFGDGNQGHAFESGSVSLLGAHGAIRLINVLFVPSLKGNLLSVSAAASRGVQITFDPCTHSANFCERDGTALLTATLSDGLYWVSQPPRHVAAIAASETPAIAQARD